MCKPASFHVCNAGRITAIRDGTEKTRFSVGFDSRSAGIMMRYLAVASWLSVSNWL